MGSASAGLFVPLLPEGCAVAEADLRNEAPPLWPAEAALVAAASAERRHEFAAGRACARRALQALGRPAAAILTGPHREPLWPPGVRGSLTHTAGYCAAALLPAARGLSIGIDAEADHPLDPELAALVLGPAEREQVAALIRQHPGRAWSTVVYSAKEALHKALFPLWPHTLEFAEAEVSLDAAAGHVQLRLLNPRKAARAGGRAIEGRFGFAPGLVLTALSLPCVAAPVVRISPASQGCRARRYRRAATRLSSPR